MNTFRKILLVIFQLAVLTTFVQGATIQWGSVLSSSLYLSDGVEVNDTNTPGINLTFSLGTFEAGFDPNEDNIEQWEANWKELDQELYSMDSQWVTAEIFLQDTDDSTAGLQFNGSTFVPGEAVYIWAYNQLNVDENYQGSLITGVDSTDTLGVVTDPSNSNWEVPDFSISNQGTTPLNWRTSTANIAVFGTVGTNTGEGRITDPVTNPTMQLATIPEPKTSLLILLMGVGALFQRRRM